MGAVRDVRALSLAGNAVAELHAVNLGEATGAVLRQEVAKAVGFPAAGIRLLNAAGARLPDGSSVEPALGQDASVDPVTVTCVLEPSKPLGTKAPGRRQRPWGSKAGMILSRRLESELRRDTPGRDVFACRRVPDVAMRKEIERLIKMSFAEHLAPMIEMGIAAAYQSVSLEEASPVPPFVYEDPELGAYAELSTCQLWAKVINPEIVADMKPFFGRRDGPGPVACAVLWRMLDAPAAADGEQLITGPVLEVLFLATCQDFRELGQAQGLVAELEEMAKALGCYAVCVAAVPAQGVTFWTRCGYEVMVPLAVPEVQEPEGPGADASDALLGEPQGALGFFLRQNMLLFTDTPLVAKVL